MKPAIEVVRESCGRSYFSEEDARQAWVRTIEADRAEHVREIREQVEGLYRMWEAWGKEGTPSRVPEHVYRADGVYDILRLPCLQLPEHEPSKEALAAAMDWTALSPKEDCVVRLARIIDKHMRGQS